MNRLGWLGVGLGLRLELTDEHYTPLLAATLIEKFETRSVCVVRRYRAIELELELHSFVQAASIRRRLQLRICGIYFTRLLRYCSLVCLEGGVGGKECLQAS